MPDTTGMENTSTPSTIPYTQSQLGASFDRVKDLTHWKNPINAYIEVEFDVWERERDLLAAAVWHFTATLATICVTRKGHKVDLHVEAPGYYAGPAN